MYIILQCIVCSFPAWPCCTYSLVCLQIYETFYVSHSKSLGLQWRKIACSIHLYIMSNRSLSCFDSVIATEESWGLEAKIMYINHICACSLVRLASKCVFICFCLSLWMKDEDSRTFVFTCNVNNPQSQSVTIQHEMWEVYTVNMF